LIWPANAGDDEIINEDAAITEIATFFPSFMKPPYYIPWLVM
jgi:hypothetical protein